MNRPNALRFDGSDQAVSTRPLAVADKPVLTAAHLSAVDPALLERVKDIFSDIRTFSSHRQVCESSFTSSLTYSSRHDRLLDPASFREKLSNLPKHATYNTGPGGQSPAVDPVKPDKKLDGWLPAPSGLRRKGVAERVTGHNLPQSLNEYAVKSASEDFRSKNLYQAGSDVKGRESGWDPRVQGYSAADKPPWSMPYPVNDSQGRWSDAQRLIRQNAEATSTSNEMRALPPAVNRLASSSATKPPGHYSQVADEGGKASVSVREQQHVEVSLPGSDKHALNTMYGVETLAWRPVAGVSRAVSQGERRVDTSAAAKWPFQVGDSASRLDSDIIVTRKMFNDYQRIEFQSFGKTLMVLKTASEDVGAPPSSRDSAKPKDDRRRHGEESFRSVSHDDRHRSEMSASQLSNRDSAPRVGDVQFSSHRADPARKGDPAEGRERSRVEFGEEMVRRGRTDMRETEDSERTSGSQSTLPVVYKDYHHRSSKQEHSGANRKSSAERDLLSGRAQAAEKSGRKSEDRSRLKKSATDDFLRTKFLLEIERREKELRRIAGTSGSHGITAMLPHAGTSHFEDDREKYSKKQELKGDSLRMVEPKAAEKRCDSDRTSSHTVKPISAGVSSSRSSLEYLSRRDEVNADARWDRSRRSDDVSSTAFDDFRRPLPPTKTDYRIPELSVGDKLRNFSLENSADVKKQHSESQSYSRNSDESAVRSSRSSTYNASDGIRSSASDRAKTNPEGEVSGGFQREERVAYWENLKAQLENEYSENQSLKQQLESEYSKKKSPVESQRRSSDGKTDPQSRNTPKVKEAGTTPKDEKSDQYGRFHVKMELSPKKEYKQEQSKVHTKMERTPKKEYAEEKGAVHVKTEHTEERSFSQSKETKKNSAEIKNRLPATTKQSVRPIRTWNSIQKVTNQGKTEKQTTRTDQAYSLNSSQKVGDQGKVERPATRTDQVHSLNSSQKVTNKDKTDKNAASKQKMASRRPNEAAGKADPEQVHKVLPPKTEEKHTADEKQDPKKTKTVNKNVTKKPSQQPITESKINASNFPRRSTAADQDDIVPKPDRKSDDLRNLLNAKPGNMNWRKREIVKRQKDDTSVILIGDPISDDENELVIEVPEVRHSTQADDAIVSVESLGGQTREIPDDERRSARKWRAADDEFESELPRKRFKFNQSSHQRSVRGGGGGFGRRGRGRGRRAFDFNQRCVIDRRSTTQIRFEGEDLSVDIDDYRHGDDNGDADLDNRRQGRRERYDEEGYFDSDDRNRVSNARKKRYEGSRSRDRSYTREQYEEIVDIHREDDEDLFRCDADDRLSKYEDGAKIYRRGDYDGRRSGSYSREERASIRDEEERFPKSRESYEEANEDARQRDNEDYDGRFSNNVGARKHFRQRSSARYSNDDTDERYRDDRSARYSSDEGNEQLRTRRYRTEQDEQFRGENDTEDVGEEYQGPYTDRPARYKRKPSRGRSFKSPIARTITFDRLKGPRSFLKDLELKCADDDYAEEEEEGPCDIEVTIEGDFYDDGDDYARDGADAVYEDVEGMVRDIRFDDARGDRADEFDYGGHHDDDDEEGVPPLLPDLPSLRIASTRFGGPSRGGSSFRTRPWKGRFFTRSARGNRFQHRFGPRGRLGFQPHGKRFLPSPKKYLRRMADPDENINISKPSNSVQEAVKQIMSNLKDAEMADPEADAALFDTLSRGEKKQVIEIQQMTGIQCVTAIVTALRTLWEFEPKVVRTLGNLEPEEIQQLGDDG